MPGPVPEQTVTATVARYVDQPRFHRRGWLADEVQAALDRPQVRFVVVTGAPGAGKSTFLAQLAREHPRWPSCFSRADQRSPSGASGARGVLLQIGWQLAAAWPHLFSREWVRISVEQRLGTLSAGASAVGAEVGRILASPFHRYAIRVSQDVETADGELAGVRVDELVTDPALLTMDQLEQMALREPAAALAGRSAEHLVILIDGLDEFRYRSTDEPLVSWLTGIDVPANVRFVLTSRPPDADLRMLLSKRSDQLCRLTIDDDDPRVRQDAVSYARGLAASPVLAQRPAGQRAAFVSRSTARAHGNLGYLDALARTLEHGRADVAALLTLDSLPEELAGLYGFLLLQVRSHLIRDRIRVADPGGEDHLADRWSAVVRPLLATLAVAFEPLPLDRLAALAGLPVELADVADSVEWLAPFLATTGEAFALYHGSLQEFLTDPATGERTETAALHVEPRRWHARVAGRLWREKEQDGAPRDDYGVGYLAEHLAAAEDDDRLRLLIDTAWLAELNRRTGSDAEFLFDVAVAAERAATGGSPVERVRLAVVGTVIRERADRFTDDDLTLLVLLGHGVQAWSYAFARRQPEKIAAALSGVLLAESARGTLLPAAVDHLEGIAGEIADIALRAQVLTTAAALRTEAGDPVAEESFTAALSTAREVTARPTRARLLLHIGLMMREAGDTRADETITEATTLAVAVRPDPHAWGRPSVQVSPRHGDWLRRDLAGALADAGLPEQAEALAAHIDDRVTRGRAMVDVVRARVRADDLAGASRAAAGIDFDLHRDHAGRLLTGAYAAAGDVDRASAELARIGRSDVRGPATVTFALGLARSGAPQAAVDAALTTPDTRAAYAAAAAVLAGTTPLDTQPPHGDRDTGWLMVLAFAAAGQPHEAARIAAELLPQHVATEPEPASDDDEWGSTAETQALLEEIYDLRVDADPFGLPPRPDAVDTAVGMLRAAGTHLVDGRRVAEAEALVPLIADPHEASQLRRTIAIDLAGRGDPRAADLWPAAGPPALSPAEASVAVLAAVGAGLAQITDPRAAAVLDAAEQRGLALPASPGHDTELAELCRHLSAAGRFTAIGRIVLRIRDEQALASAYRHLLVGLVQDGRDDEVEEHVERHGLQTLPEDARWTVGVARLRGGRTSAGIAALATLTSPYIQSSAVTGATTALLETGQYRTAVRLLLDLPWHDEIAARYWAQLVAAAQPFAPVADALLTLDPQEREQVLGDVALSVARAGRHVELDWLAKALPAEQLAQAALLAARAAAAAGDAGQAQAWLDRIADPEMAAVAYCLAAGELVRAGAAAAASMLQGAQQAVAALEPNARAAALPGCPGPCYPPTPSRRTASSTRF